MTSIHSALPRTPVISRSAHMEVARRVGVGTRASLLGLVLAVMGAAGCGQNRNGVGDLSTLTRGIALQFDNRDTATIRVVLATVEPEGQITFSGGMDAFSGRTSWSGTLSVEQADELVRILMEDGWVDGTVQASGTPRSRIARVVVEDGAGKHRYSLTGESEAVDRLDAFLNEVSSARFESFMRKLPEPGEQSR